MTEKEPEFTPKKLSAEDQARVDRYLRSGYNDVERKPFRPILLLVAIVGVLTLLSLLSLLIAQTKGVV
ncbi:DUF3094 family protein [Microbulbifer pacificus]|uniref:DUF3094 family protein n=1 Tax=Microbulbifer pacificus TaxID=407164 RepID=A0AAU0N401_9GAMM|nr:DUF3094 family protein [Microbulbifer pacificus]WOX07100.1 DUF3094 family protein [Microbulbifer pacificus]